MDSHDEDPDREHLRRELDSLPGLASSSGDLPMTTTTTLVLTRFGLRDSWNLLQTFRDFRQIEPTLRRRASDGLLKAAFLIDGPRSCFSMSLWSSETAIARFGADADAHTRVARRVFPRLRFTDRRPELWSTKWRLIAVSRNLNWAGAPVVPMPNGTER